MRLRGAWVLGCNFHLWGWSLVRGPGGGQQGGFILCPFGRRKLLLLLSCVVWFVRFASDSYEFRIVSSLLGSLGLEDGKCKSCDFFQSLLSSFERFFFPLFMGFSCCGMILLWSCFLHVGLVLPSWQKLVLGCNLQLYECSIVCKGIVCIRCWRSVNIIFLEPRVMHQDAFWLICALMSDDLNGGVWASHTELYPAMSIAA